MRSPVPANTLDQILQQHGTRHCRLEIADDAALDADLNLIYADDAEPSDTVLFDLLEDNPDPCPNNPGGHEFIGKCGETRCRHCKRIVG